MNGNDPAKCSGTGNGRGPNANGWNPWCLVFDLGSLGPSTVTLIALLYVATCGGLVDTMMESVKLFPEIWEQVLAKK